MRMLYVCWFLLSVVVEIWNAKPQCICIVNVKVGVLCTELTLEGVLRCDQLIWAPHVAWHTVHGWYIHNSRQCDRKTKEPFVLLFWNQYYSIDVRPSLLSSVLNFATAHCPCRCQRLLTPHGSHYMLIACQTRCTKWTGTASAAVLQRNQSTV